MISKETLHTWFSEMGREKYFELVREVKSWAETLITLWAQHYEDDSTPAETVEKLVNAIGKGPAAMIIATAVNQAGDWDARVGRAARQWAVGVPDSLDSDASRELWLNFDRIHRCHIDQLALAAKKQIEL